MLLLFQIITKDNLTDSQLREIASRSKLSFLDTKKQYNQEWANLFTFY